MCSERHLVVTSDFDGQKFYLSLPLYGLIEDQCGLSIQISENNQLIALIRKKSPIIWPRLLESDDILQCLNIRVTERRLSLKPSYDTIDFDAVVSGRGDRTGLEM
ncbi:hypothetical protein EC973_008023 [Apophysomyces ossiformis]|uniref:CS domain-containing protein n=1 Tax=Apophysomyces ossiformis TaxID=679940 RepID=A0A8H7BLH5_9FUNG|nr:hypothetical protein EC973_008023 [Apophysomyces ossiformis]